MIVFVVVSDMRQTGTNVEVWADRTKAISRAKTLADEAGEHWGVHPEEFSIESWEWAATVGEDDWFWVKKVEVNE